jgi:hypothetical protein
VNKSSNDAVSLGLVESVRAETRTNHTINVDDVDGNRVFAVPLDDRIIRR